ncbi:MAG: PhoH family protein [Planctomycetales bacterium]|nr:PhoH family protein [Planctomycetales bacterium]
MIDHAERKLFVLDTNVILHDAHCLEKFEEHDVAIPITVLEELDHFKRGNEDIHFQARQFLRQLDELTGPVLSAEGVSRGKGQGNVRVVLGSSIEPDVRAAFLQDSPDHRILNCAVQLSKQHPGPVVLVTKDTNLRMKARSLGIAAEDFTADKLPSFDELYAGSRTVEDIPGESIDPFYALGSVPRDALPQIENPVANENFILRNGSKSVLATYSAETDSFQRVSKPSAYGIQPRNAEQSFALTALLDDDIKLVTLAGRAGSGKTLLALAAALECRTRYRQIMLARPVVPLSNRDLGYLPGDIQDKLAPYMQPLFDNLTVIRHHFGDKDPMAERINEMLETEKLVISPLSYIRGRSLQRMFFIVDEAQNLTPHEVKTIITRAGEGTKIVFTGDVQQIDQPYLDSLSNGLSHLINRMVGHPIYAHITLRRGERSLLADVASERL